LEHIFRRVKPRLAALLLLLPLGAARAQSLESERLLERQTTSGALFRAERQLEIVNRGAQLQRENFGRQGRVNSTGEAARQTEEPRAIQPGFSPWGRF
jgi:hypothetical protein